MQNSEDLRKEFNIFDENFTNINADRFGVSHRVVFHHPVVTGPVFYYKIKIPQ